MDRENETGREAVENEIIEGRNAVIEALRAGRAIDKIFIAKGDVDKTLGHIASRARERGVVVVEADRRKLDFMSRTKAHQGVVALAAVRDYCEVADILAVAEERGEPPVEHRPHRAHRACDRFGGGRHGPSGAGELRFCAQPSHEGTAQFPQRLRRGSRHDV